MNVPMSKPMVRRSLLLGLAMGAIVIAGCAGGRIAGGPQALPAGEESPAFLDRAAAQPTVSENDAFRGILMLMRDNDDAGTFADRVRILQQNKIVDASWDFITDRPITKGKLAYMLCQVLKMPGGVLLTLTGPSQRYCLRELQYQHVMSAGFFTAPVTGMEFVGVLARADAWKRTGEVPDVMQAAAERGI